MRVEPNRLLLAPNSCVMVYLDNPRHRAESEAERRETDVLLRCASVLSIPVIVVIEPDLTAANGLTAPEHPENSIALEQSPDPWQHAAFAERMNTLRRDQLLLLGNPVDPSITFAALGALRLAIDVFMVVHPNSEPLRRELADLRLTRLRQYGVVAIDVTQAVVELAATSDQSVTAQSTEAIVKRFGL